MRIVADSGCDLTNEMKTGDGINVKVVPLTLQVDDKEFIDDEKLVVSDYMDIMERSKGVVKTAAPSPAQYFEKFKEEGSVFVVTLSSQLSASYANAMLAKKLYLEEIGNKFIHVIDSVSAASAETLIALKLNDFFKKNLSENEIVTKITSFIESMSTYFILEKYDNAVKNGRMSPYVAKIAGFLSICPICAAVNGKMEVVDKARGAKKAVTKLIDTISKQAVDFENRILAISHVSCLEKALSFKDEVLKKINFKDVIIMDTSGLCSTYAERGGLIIAY